MTATTMCSNFGSFRWGPRVVLRYIKDGQPIERFLTFLEMKSHTSEEMANQVF